MPKVTPKASFWRPQGPLFHAKLPIATSCKNINTYNGLGTFRGSKGARLGTQKPTLNPSAPRRSFWDTFFGLSGRPGAPKRRKGTQKAKGVPKGARGDPKCTPNRSQIRSGTPWGAKGVPGVPPGPKMTPKWSENCPKLLPKWSRN